MPILNDSNKIKIIYKNNKINCSLLFETVSKIALVIEDQFPDIEKLKYEVRLDFETRQGNYDCYFQSKVEFVGYDMIHKKYIIEIDYPAVFKRILNPIRDN
jgi:hypothetical protein